MSKSKSITIRVPTEIFDLIECFPDGETRTDKIINMLILASDYSANRKDIVSQSQDGDLQNVMHRLTVLEKSVSQLQGGDLQNASVLSAPSYNQQRSEETLNNIQAIISTMSNDDKINILKARYPKSSFRKFSNETISKDSVAKYWDLIKSQLMR